MRRVSTLVALIHEVIYAMDKRCSATYSFFKLLRTWSKSNIKGKSTTVVQHEPLEHILRDKFLSELFQEWATQNLCSENLQFYQEVLSFQTRTSQYAYLSLDR